VSAPRVQLEEVEILSPTEMIAVLANLEHHPLYPIVALALGTGMRRGELLGLQWGDVDLDGATARVERSLEETSTGVRYKSPKTKSGRRVISLPPSAVEALRAHRRQQLELRVALGHGRVETETPVFCTAGERPLSPNNLSRDWHRVVVARGLPKVMFHVLRHSHASALIASGMDVVSVSKRLGHGSPAITLTVYAHLFQKADGPMQLKARCGAGDSKNAVPIGWQFPPLFASHAC